MINVNLIGRLGADAEVKQANGREFTTFRVAHSNKWRTEKGEVQEETIWVDCVFSGKSNVLQYLTKGIQVYVSGAASLRVYSSKKDRCMKAGLTVNVRQVELLASVRDEVPSVLYRTDNGQMVEVKTYHGIDPKECENKEGIWLQSNNGKSYFADKLGWVKPNNAQNDISDI